MAFERLARAEEIEPGRTKYLCPGGRPVILANFEGGIYALSGICPHRQNPLEGAVLWDHWIDCPFHHFQYDIRTGENHFPRNVYPADMPQLREQLRPLAVFPVKIEDGWVWADLDPAI